MTDDERRDAAKAGLRALVELASNPKVATVVRVKAAAAILGVDADEDDDEDEDEDDETGDPADPDLVRVEAAKALLAWAAKNSSTS